MRVGGNSRLSLLSGVPLVSMLSVEAMRTRTNWRPPGWSWWTPLTKCSSRRVTKRMGVSASGLVARARRLCGEGGHRERGIAERAARLELALEEQAEVRPALFPALLHAVGERRVPQ